MVNLKATAAAFIALTVIFGGTTAYLLTGAGYSSHTVTSTAFSTVTQAFTTTQTTTAPAPTYTVNLVYKPGIGFYFTNGTGFTLYFRQTDPGDGTSTCTGSCVTVWPLFYSSKIVVPPDVNASAFTIVNRTDGKQQLAFEGYPLYYYQKDVKPGDVLGQGIGHFFACCTVTATAVTTAVSATTTAGGFAISIAKGASTNQSSLGYSPSAVTLVIGVNNTVTWTNNDVTIHTVTSFSVPTGAKSFNSGTLSPGSTFTYAFTVAGTYRYGCEIHPWMQGTIIVEG